MLKDGLWLHLPEAPYFNQRRLGSSDITRLYLRKEGFWWSSFLNPSYVPESRGALTYGRGFHKITLEGVRAYEAEFAIMPDKDTLRAEHGDKFCVTVKELLEALEKRGSNPKANAGKPFLIEYARTRAPDLVIWDKVVEDWQAKNEGKQGLSLAEDREIRIMADCIHNHPEMGELFKFNSTNIPIAEVSVLYHDEHGIPRRNRIDLMLPTVNMNLKSLGNVGGQALKFAVGEHLARLGYHIGLADEHVARHWAYKFIREGKVYDGLPADERTPEHDELYRLEVEWLKRFPTEAPRWDNVLGFVQKPDAKNGHAPIFFPWWEDRGSDLHMRGIRCRRQAIQLYRECIAKFPEGEPWTRVERVHTAEEGAVNRVILPHWIGGDEEMPDEDSDL
jgi:hypothetical protein